MATDSAEATSGEHELRTYQDDTLHINLTPNESTVKRDLRHYHVVFICISGVLGGGLYIRSGTILEVGSVEAVAVSYVVLGVLGILVMRTIGEMILIWPIPNALVFFVREFVDVELSTTVAMAYWFTYSTGFASLLSAAASESGIWTCSRSVQGYGFLLAPTVILLLLACLPVKLYGHLEVFGGSMKLLFITTVIIATIYIAAATNTAFNNYSNAGTRTGYQQTEANNESIAVIMGLQIAAWGFVGIEIPAALALEVKLDKEIVTTAQHSFQNSRGGDESDQYSPANRALKFSVKWLPALTASVYLIAGMVAAATVRSTSHALPSTKLNDGNTICAHRSSSVFIIAAQNSGIPGLADSFTVFLIFTAWSSALTALYVASRTLFAATREMDDPSNYRGSWQRPFRILLKYCSHTTAGQHVPVWALIVSTLFFVWLPAIYIATGSTTVTVLGVLTEMGSVCCLFVWACECLAYLQFSRNRKRHTKSIDASCDRDMRFLRRGTVSSNDSPGIALYPWAAWGQPGIALLGFLGCTFILVVAGGSAIWRGWQGAEPAFFAAYLPLILFLCIWLVMKICKIDWKELSEERERWRETPANQRSDLSSSLFGYSLQSWEFGFKPAIEKLNTIRGNRIDKG